MKSSSLVLLVTVALLAACGAPPSVAPDAGPPDAGTAPPTERPVTLLLRVPNLTSASSAGYGARTSFSQAASDLQPSIESGARDELQPATYTALSDASSGQAQASFTLERGGGSVRLSGEGFAQSDSASRYGVSEAVTYPLTITAKSPGASRFKLTLDCQGIAQASGGGRASIGVYQSASSAYSFSAPNDAYCVYRSGSATNVSEDQWLYPLGTLELEQPADSTGTAIYQFNVSMIAASCVPVACAPGVAGFDGSISFRVTAE